MADKKTTPPRFHVSPWHRLKGHLLRLPILLVWGAALTAALLLYLRQERGFIATAFVEEVRYQVAPTACGRVKRLEVSLHQQVAKGQIVALLEDDLLLLQLKETRLELNRLSSELEREDSEWTLDATGLEVDQATNLRRFARDAETAHIEYLEAVAELAEDRVQLQGLSLNLMRSEDLSYYDYTPVSTVDDDRTAHEALQERITRLEPRLMALEKRYQDADARYENFVTRHLKDLPGAEAMLKPLACAVKVQEVRIEAVNLALLHLVLRAPADGRVEQIHCRSGETVDLGRPVITLVDPKPSELVAYVPEEEILQVKPGHPVKIRRKAAPHSLHQAIVSQTGTAICELPARLNPFTTLPRWGLTVHIALPQDLNPKPGESFEVLF